MRRLRAPINEIIRTKNSPYRYPPILELCCCCRVSMWSFSWANNWNKNRPKILHRVICHEIGWNNEKDRDYWLIHPSRSGRCLVVKLLVRIKDHWIIWLLLVINQIPIFLFMFLWIFSNFLPSSHTCNHSWEHNLNVIFENISCSTHFFVVLQESHFLAIVNESEVARRPSPLFLLSLFPFTQPQEMATHYYASPSCYYISRLYLSFFSACPTCSHLNRSLHDLNAYDVYQEISMK